MATKVNEKTEVNRIRRERAERMETEAFSAELDVLQYDSLPASAEKRPGFEDATERVRDRADQLREQANAAHSRAGTSPNTFASKHRELANARVVSFQTALIKEKEWLDAPEVYCDNLDQLDPWLDDRRWTIQELTHGLKAIEKKAAELQKDAETEE